MANTSSNNSATTVDQRSGNSPDPNQIAKANHQLQIVLNGHTSQLARLEALLSKLILQNNLKHE